jgi:hypothetical protein
LLLSTVSHAAIVKVGHMDESSEETRKKFTVGEEEEAQPAVYSSQPVKKAHAKHHVKRKSGGRVHVSKLMQMTRTASQSHEDGDGHNPEAESDARRSIIVRRSSSQRSLPRLAAMEKLSEANPTELEESSHNANSHAISNAVSNATSTSINNVESKASHAPRLMKHEPSVATAKVTAYTALADNLVTGTKSAPSNSPAITEDRKPVKSQFVSSTPDTSPASSHSGSQLAKKNKSSSQPDLSRMAVQRDSQANASDSSPSLYHDQRSHGSDASMSSIQMAASTAPTAMTRTQQKLLLQRQHFLADDENNLAHPRNQLRLTKEMEHMDREYMYLRRYQDPMTDSLIRCVKKQQRSTLSPSHSESSAIRHSHPQRSLSSRSIQDAHLTSDNTKRWSNTASNLLDRVLGSN